LDDGRAELQKQIDGLADIFIDDVAAFRDVSRDKVLSDFGQGSTFLANEAINLGMADEISSLRDVIAELTTADTSNNNTNNLNNINNNGVSQMGVKSKRDKQNFSLKATGKTKADDDEKDSDDTGAEDLDEDRNESSEDDEDDEVDEACEIKPIVAYVQGMACSAAYWIASATSHIYVDKTATLGSIGVVAAWTDDSKARTAAGLTDYEVVSSQSPKKRLDPKLDDGRAELQKQIDGLADIFIDDVAAFRDVSRDKVLSDFGQGSTFLANEAINLGMADEISSLRDVIAELTTADTSNNNTNNLNNINNNGVSQMGVKSKRDKQNFSLKATGKTKADDDEKDSDDTGAEDLDEDRNESSEDDEDDEGYEGFDDEDVDDEEESSSEDDDDKETDATKKAISAFARKNPRLYRAILKRGARTERRRIASIEKLNIVGHKNLIHQAKYSKRLTAEQTSYEVLKAEQQQRSKLSDDYASDGSYRVPTSAASVTNKNDDIPSSFFENVAAGARAVLRGKK